MALSLLVAPLTEVCIPRYRAPQYLVDSVMVKIAAGDQAGLDYVRTGLVGVNDKATLGDTPLLAACYALWLPAVRELVTLGADASARGQITSSCVDAAALGGADRQDWRTLCGKTSSLAVDKLCCARILKLLLNASGSPFEAIGRDVDKTYLLELRATAERRGFSAVVAELNRVLPH